MSIEQQLADVLESNAQLMQRLNEAVAKCLDSAQNAVAAVRALTEHNNNEEAHPDIRALVKDGVVSETILENAIRLHDESANAHPALMAKIQTALEDLTTVNTLVSETVTEHNLSLTSHPDLRENINTVMDLLGGLNVTEINDQLAELATNVNTEVANQIVALQNVDAKHDSQINNNSSRVSELERKCTEQQETTTILTNQQNQNTVNIDTLLLRIAPLEQYINKQIQDASIDMTDFTCTFPAYVGRNTVVTFRIYGVKSANASDHITYSISDVSNGIVIDTLENITDDTDITAAIKANNEIGSLVSFTVTATNVETGGTSQKTVAGMITKPVSTANVSITNFPSGVEPGGSYAISIQNMEDDGSDRFSYSFACEDATFVPDELGKGTLTTVMTVSSEIARESQLPVTLVIHDKFGEDQNKYYTTTVNPQPDTSNFTHTVPAVIAPEVVYQIKFSGITSITGNPATYSIENTNTVLAFSKVNNILPNENITCIASSAANRGSTYTFTVVATDENNAISRMTVSTKINQLPTSTTIQVSGLETPTFGGVTQTLKITGGNDAETEAANMKYVIDAGNSGLTFSRLTGISAGENITMRVPKVAADATRSFYIYAVDAMGEKAITPKQVDVVIKAIHVPDTPSITNPTNGSSVDWDFILRWTAYTEHIEV